ncbi:MAG: hypothetical protein IJN44_07300, partial [Clostridia bacterium]|nr:hypothetical protein [Clostridia bacterium]
FIRFHILFSSLRNFAFHYTLIFQKCIANSAFYHTKRNHRGLWPHYKGFHPLTLTRGIAPGPSRAIGPAPSSGTYSSYLKNCFPPEQENPAGAKKLAPLCKGSWPVGPEGLSSPLQETRKNPYVKEDCNFASWMRHWRPHHGPAAECRQPDALHPEKTTKRSGERIHSLNRSFFVFIMPVVLFLFISFADMRKNE